MKLSEKIRILRKARGMSQEEFGYSLSEATEGVTRQTVSDWENGKFEPKLDNIRDIARVLNVSFDVLLDEKIDLNDAETLKSVLYAASKDRAQKIRSSARYAISFYAVNRGHCIKLWIWISFCLILIVGIILLIVGSTKMLGVVETIGVILSIVGSILTVGFMAFLIEFIVDYRNPCGGLAGDIDNTHLTIYAQQTASNVICIPLEKVKDIRLGEKTKKRHGNLVVLLDGREKPITLQNVAFPQGTIDFYRKLLQTNDDPDSIQIL